MNIHDLKDGDKKVNLEAKVYEIKERTTKSGKRVADVTIQDASGKGTLVLWEDAIDEVKEGDAIQVENGYVSSYQGKVQLNVGQWGHLTNLGLGHEPPKQDALTHFSSANTAIGPFNAAQEARIRQIVAEELQQ